ncbi:hypothetical protein ABAC402_06080 [Asticcacaulis sp. AC402]|nr:hypothetical protein ABAC402_06080 [Asticcacaulis sp. AC402]
MAALAAGLLAATPVHAQQLSDSDDPNVWAGQVGAAGLTVQPGYQYIASTSGDLHLHTTPPGSPYFTVNFTRKTRAFQFLVNNWATCCLPSVMNYSLDGGPVQQFGIRTTPDANEQSYLGLIAATPFTSITLYAPPSDDSVSVDGFWYALNISPIDTAEPYYLASELGQWVTPDFEGGTLRMDQVGGVYGQNFTVSASAGNTIDAFGHTATFTGNFSNATTGVPGSITLSDSVGGGQVVVEAAWGSVGDALGTVTNHTSLTVGATGQIHAQQVVNNGTLSVANGGTVLAALSNAGTVSNAGTLAGGVVNDGDFTSTGTVGGGVINSAAFTANGGQVNGAISNLAGGDFDIAGTVTSDSTFANAGDLTVTSGSYGLTGALTNGDEVLVQSGAALNAGSLVNQASATVSNNGSVAAAGSNAGNITNAGLWSGSLVNTGLVSNLAAGTLSGPVSNSASLNSAGTVSGWFDNIGTVMATGGAVTGGVDNHDAGTVTIAGAVTGAGSFTNRNTAQLRVTGGSLTGLASLNNSSTHTQGVTTAAGTTLSADLITNAAGSRIDNAGTLTAATRFDNAGSVVTTGVLNGPLFNAAGGQVWAQGQVFGPVDNSGVFEVTGALTNNGDGFVNRGVLTVKGNFTGLAGLTNISTQTQSVTIAGGATLSAGQIANGAASQVTNAGTVTVTSLFDNAGGLTSTGTLNGPLFNTGQVWARGQVNGAVDNSGQFVVTGALTGNGAGFLNRSTLTVGGNSYTGLGAADNRAAISIGTGSATGTLGAASFSNSGSVAMANGLTGDRVVLSGAYTGTAGSSLSFDANLGSNGNLSDRLSAGSTSGQTRVSIRNTAASRIYFSAPIVLISGGSGGGTFTAAADAQTQAALSSNNVVDYSFRQIVGGNDWGVVAALNTGAVATVPAHTRAFAVSLTDFYPDAHDLAAEAEGDGWSGRIWGRAVRGGNRFDMTTTASDAYSPAAEQTVRLAFDGFQGGGDVQRSGGWGSLQLGVTGGQVHGRAKDELYRSRYDMPFYGVYAVASGEHILASLQAYSGELEMTPDDFLSARPVDGTVDTLAASLAALFPVGEYTVEPYAAYSSSRVKTDVVGLDSGLGSLDSRPLTVTTAGLGVRLSTEDMRGVVRLRPFVLLGLAEDQGDPAVTAFMPAGGADPVTLTTQASGSYTRIASGVEARFGNGAEAYLRGEARIGEDLTGFSVVAGARMAF